MVLAEAEGEVHLYFDEFRFILLKYWLYVLNFKRNLISVACLIKDCYSVLFDKTEVIPKDKSFLYYGCIDSNLYFIKPEMYTLPDTKLIDNSKKLKFLTLTRHIFGI